MTFSEALWEIKAGRRMYRIRWNGKGQFVFLERAQAERPGYLVLKNVDDEIIPWVPSQIDLLAEDWETADATK